MQLFGIAKNMTNINIAPFMGGILMNNTAWRRIPEQYQEQLRAVCKQVETDIDGSFSRLEADAISTMSRYGLNVLQLNSRQVQEWYDDMAKYESSLAGPIFNRPLYQRIKLILEDYRRGR
jgi:TRAP-type C4-dicarboxylate transport system substrate-binding protein